MDYEIVDIFEGELTPGVEGWDIIQRTPDGSLRAHAIPKVALEWRAAEYGLESVDEIFDILLHEAYVGYGIVTPPSTMNSVIKSDTPPKKSRVAAEVPLPGLYEAKSTQEARDAHRERIAKVKTDTIRVTDPQGLLSYITANPEMDSDSIREKRERVDTQRWIKLYGELPDVVKKDLAQRENSGEVQQMKR